MATEELLEIPVEEAPDESSAVADLNSFFLLLSGYLVFFMQCGFCMLSAGSVRSKNAKNIILKNLLDACFGALGFYFFGFAVAYGKDNDHFIGGKDGHMFALHKLPVDSYSEFFFQYAFAATAATIVSGAVAERTRFEAYLGYAFFLTAFVYPVVVHWVWDGAGWLSAFYEPREDRLLETGMIDFAGCGVVHMVGGFAGLAGAAIVGPRVGRYDGNTVREIPGHSASLALLGVFILWFGWYGFNPGSALAIIGAGPIASLCAVTTTLAAAAGTISTLSVTMLRNYLSTGQVVWDTIAAGNGALAGLVGITASTSVVKPWAAVLIGLIAGVVYVFSSYLVSHVMKVDDPLDAVAVHGFCGMWGLLAVGVFADENLVSMSYAGVYHDQDGNPDDIPHGFVMGGDGRLLATAIIGIICIFSWVMVLMVPFFYATKMLDILRVSPEEENEGLDISHHGGSAYPSDLVKMDAGDGPLRKEIQSMKEEIELMKRSR